jgi:hypothetical protein
MQRIVVVIALMCAGLMASPFRDVLFLKNGEEVRCTILRITEKQAIVRMKEGEKKYDLKEVVRATMTHERKGDLWMNVKDIDDNTLLEAIATAQSRKNDFPLASYVVLESAQNYSFDSKGKCRYTNRSIVLILNQRAKNVWASYSFGFTAPWQTGDIDFCRTVASDGSVYHLDDAALEFSEPMQWTPQYNCYRKIKFAVPHLGVGCVMDFQYHIDYAFSDFMHPITAKTSFGGDEPILNKSLTIEYPQSLGDNFVAFDAYREPVKVSKNGTTALGWSEKNIAPFVREPNTAPASMFLASVWVGFGTDLDKAQKALSDSLNKAFKPSKKLDKFTDSLLTGCKTPLERFSKIYEYLNVSYRTTYIGPGMYSWFPTPVDKVFASGVANNLDLCAMMVYMCGHAGLSGKIVYASGVSDADAILEVPSLGFYGSPLVEVMIDARRIVCSPMWKYAPFTVIPTDQCGQKALFIGANEFHVGTVPNNIIENYASLETVDVALQPNGDANVRLTRVYGDIAGIGYKYYRDTRKDQLDKDFETEAGSYLPGAKMNSYSLTGIFSTDSTVVVKFDIFVPQFAQTDGKQKLAFQLPGLNYSTSSYSLETRTTPMYFSEPQLAVRIWRINEPAAFGHEFIPQKVVVNGDSAIYNLEFDTHKTSQLVVREMNLRLKKLVTIEGYPKYRADYITLSKTGKNWILLDAVKENKESKKKR